jgi:hypothetical protein
VEAVLSYGANQSVEEVGDLMRDASA